MTITDAMRTRILSTMREQRIKQTELAEKMGYGKAWVTKLLDGTLKTLSDEGVERLEEFLGIEFFRITPTSKEVSGLGIKVSEMSESDPDLVVAIEAMLRLADKAEFTSPYIETKDMSRIGQEIIRICFANEDKPGKVAREVLQLLNEYPKRSKKKVRY